MDVHVFRAAVWPAMRFPIDGIGRRHWMRYPAHRALWARCCRRRRWASHLTAGVSYDDVSFWCRKGMGCKR